ncbi:type IV secretion system protein, partial [Kingella kingae]|uniref:virB8 family protein n=1 Tax=Kingella kingae TaxID=504 RepID=UPI00254D165A
IRDSLTGLAVGAVLGLTPLKTVQPFVIRVDNNTGATDIVTTMKKQEKSYGEVMDKFWLAQYVRYREGYDWQTVQDTFDATNLLSSQQEQVQFSQIYKDNPNAPHKILRDTAKVVVKANAIAFVGNMAQVRFEKAVIPLNKSDMQPAPQRYIATIAYEYKNAGMKDEDRLINPLGFQVTSYRVDKEHIQ